MYSTRYSVLWVVDTFVLLSPANYWESGWTARNTVPGLRLLTVLAVKRSPVPYVMSPTYKITVIKIKV